MTSTPTSNAEIEPAANVATPESVVRRYLEEFVNGGSLDVLNEVWATDGVWHGGSMGEHHGLDQMLAFAQAGGGAAFSGMHLVIEDVITAGDKVVVRFTNNGTQVGTFMGAPASGKHASWLGIAIYTVQDGQIIDAWFGEDILGMLLQLGIVTLPS